MDASQIRRIAFVAVSSIGLLGCNPEGPEKPRANGADADPKPSATTVDDVRREVNEAILTASDYTYEKKAEYLTAAAEKLEVWEEKTNACISRLKAKAETANEKAREEIDATVEKLEKQKVEAKKKYENLKESSQSAWGDISKGMEDALTSMKKGFEDASSRFD